MRATSLHRAPGGSLAVALAAARRHPLPPLLGGRAARRRSTTNASWPRAWHRKGTGPLRLAPLSHVHVASVPPSGSMCLGA
eukprot:9354376-Pyramimonas_sp.AAC.1